MESSPNLTPLAIPDYWLPQPTWQWGEEERRAADALLHVALAQGHTHPLTYTLPQPKWQFLCYVAAQHKLALHGSGNAAITHFIPNQPHDFQEFGAQNAVYAAADGIWPIYYAIVNRAKSHSINNGCIYVEQRDGSLGTPHYFFSITQKAMANDPYQTGVVYLLPHATFRREPPMELAGWRIHTAQLASAEPVVPLAKLAVEPDDFPFLAQMRTHDHARLGEYAAAMARGLPLPT